jgi:hypothetical protein
MKDLVPYSRAVQRNLIKGLANYNILQNPKYKEAFGITWKFAIDHNNVRSVRKLKLRALNANDDDNIEDMDVCFLSFFLFSFFLNFTFLFPSPSVR